MKEKILHFGSYLLVAMLATVITLTMVHLEIGLKPSKLDQLETLIEEKFIGESDPEKLADAAANAMVTTLAKATHTLLRNGLRKSAATSNARVGSR